MRSISLVGVLLAVSALSIAQIKPYKLMISDEAPPLTVSSWLQGTPVSGFEKGHIYVLDFWATWCGPCRRSIPHLAKINEKYKDKVTLIGVDVWEPDTKKVQPFLQKRGDIAFDIALDQVDPQPKDLDPKKVSQWADEHGHMARGWLGASGRDKIGIPATYVINGDGKVAWIGDPADLEKTLDGLLDGTFDISASAEKHRTTMAHFEAGRPLSKEFDDAVDKKQWAAAIEACNKLLALDPVIFDDSAVEKFSIMLQNQNLPALAYAYGREILGTTIKSDPDELNALARAIIDPKAKIEERDYDLAIQAAQQGIEVTLGSKSSLYNTLANAYFAKGDKPKAIESIEAGIALATPDEKETLQKSLDTFQKTK